MSRNYIKVVASLRMTYCTVVLVSRDDIGLVTEVVSSGTPARRGPRRETFDLASRLSTFTEDLTCWSMSGDFKVESVDDTAV
jgi:hypothetical protein